MLQSFVVMASIITSVTSCLMASRMILHRRSSPADAKWLFKGFLFTLLLLIPLLLIGWTPQPGQATSLLSAGPQSGQLFQSQIDHGKQTNSSDKYNEWSEILEALGMINPLEFPIQFAPLSYNGGFAGAFIVESAVHGAKLVKAAVVMFHINV